MNICNGFVINFLYNFCKSCMSLSIVVSVKNGSQHHEVTAGKSENIKKMLEKTFEDHVTV